MHAAHTFIMVQISSIQYKLYVYIALRCPTKWCVAFIYSLMLASWDVTKKVRTTQKIFPPLTLYNNAIKLCAQVYATVRSHEIMSQCSCQMVLTDATVHMKQFIFMTTG